MIETDSTTTLEMFRRSEKVLLSRSEERAYIERVRAGDEEAKNELTELNLRLVASVAKIYNYSDPSLSVDDLIQIGVDGLRKAIDKFKPEKGNKLSTYAVPWIKQAIRREIESKGGSIRVPSYISLRLARLRRDASSYREDFGKEPSLVDLCEYCGVDDFTTEKLKKVSTVVSSDVLMDEDETTALIDQVVDHSNPDPQKSLLAECDREELLSHLEILTDFEREIIVEFFGLEDSIHRTLDEIGKKRGVTREWIRQKKKQALQKLRDNIEAQEGSSLLVNSS